MTPPSEHDATRKKLMAHRRRIDTLDCRILALLSQRAGIAVQIGDLKRHTRMPVVELARERQVVRNMVEQNNGPLDDRAVRRIFRGIMSEMREVQRRRIRAAR
jgi:chorismate mutase-like protein